MVINAGITGREHFLIVLFDQFSDKCYDIYRVAPDFVEFRVAVYGNPVFMYKRKNKSEVFPAFIILIIILSWHIR